MDVFEALADPLRRGLLRTLASAPARVVDLTEGRGVSRPAVSRHLRVLSEAGLVVGEPRGRETWYRLRPAGLHPVTALVNELGTPAVTPPVPAQALDALGLEVRRTVRERRTSSQPVDPTVIDPTVKEHTA